MKRKFREAYAYALKVQRACMFKPVSVQVELQYCEQNREPGRVTAWTVYLGVFDWSRRVWICAKWCEWDPERFDREKQKVINYLKEKGIEL